jgi:hypothetical protein
MNNSFIVSYKPIEKEISGYLISLGFYRFGMVAMIEIADIL